MSSMEEKLARKGTRTAPDTRQVRMTVRHLGVFAAVRVGLLVGAVVGVVTIVVLLLLFAALSATGGLAGIDQTVSTLLGGPAAPKLSGTLTVATVFAFGFIVAVVQVISTTILSVIVALLYNLSVRFTGGLLVGFTNP